MWLQVYHYDSLCTCCVGASWNFRAVLEFDQVPTGWDPTFGDVKVLAYRPPAPVLARADANLVNSCNGENVLLVGDSSFSFYVTSDAIWDGRTSDFKALTIAALGSLSEELPLHWGRSSDACSGVDINDQKMMRDIFHRAQPIGAPAVAPATEDVGGAAGLASDDDLGDVGSDEENVPMDSASIARRRAVQEEREKRRVEGEEAPAPPRATLRTAIQVQQEMFRVLGDVEIVRAQSGHVNHTLKVALGRNELCTKTAVDDGHQRVKEPGVVSNAVHHGGCSAVPSCSSRLPWLSNAVGLLSTLSSPCQFLTAEWPRWLPRSTSALQQ